MKLPAAALVAAALRSCYRPADIISMQDPTFDPAAAKADLRKQAAAWRTTLMESDPDAPARLAAQADIIINIAQQDAPDGSVAAYMPIRSELSPLPLVTALRTAGLVTAMPETPAPDNPLVFRRWAPGDDVVDGSYGTSQPSPAVPVVRPRVILAPMLAFDAGCWRLGYGGGFYDRTIAGMRGDGHVVTVIGIAFDGQLVDKVPVGPFDMPLDAVLTPSGLRAGSAQD